MSDLTGLQSGRNGSSATWSGHGYSRIGWVWLILELTEAFVDPWPRCPAGDQWRFLVCRFTADRL